MQHFLYKCCIFVCIYLIEYPNKIFSYLLTIRLSTHAAQSFFHCSITLSGHF